MKEFARIHTYLKPLAASFSGALGLSDDAALIPAGNGMSYAITKDAIVESVHFLPHTEAGLIARKLLRTNLSDCAAMGATPRWYLIAAALPATVDNAWYEAFTHALMEEQTRWGITLIGGDTTTLPPATPPHPITLSLTLLGEVPTGKALRRNGAKLGDDVYVSGTLGDAALGLRVLQQKLLPVGDPAPLIQRYHLPEPRVALGQHLRELATSCMDISDGLLADMAHLANASGAAAMLHAETLPLSESAYAMLLQDAALLEIIATGGDDYELLFTAPSANAKAIAELAHILALPLTRIGQITPRETAGENVRLLDASGKALSFRYAGYEHG